MLDSRSTPWVAPGSFRERGRLDHLAIESLVRPLAFCGLRASATLHFASAVAFANVAVATGTRLEEESDDSYDGVGIHPRGVMDGFEAL